MYKVVIKNNKILMITTASRIEGDCDIYEFETMEAAEQYIEDNNLEYSDNYN